MSFFLFFFFLWLFNIGWGQNWHESGKSNLFKTKNNLIKHELFYSAPPPEQPNTTPHWPLGRRGTSNCTKLQLSGCKRFKRFPL